MTIYENKNDKRGLPFIDNGRLSLVAIMGMLIVPVCSTLLAIYLSEYPKFLREIVGNSRILHGVAILIVTILPVLISGYAVYFFSGRNLKQYFQEPIFKYWRSLIVYFFAYVIYDILITRLVRSGANIGISVSYDWGSYFLNLFVDLFDLANEEFLAIAIFIAVAAFLKQYLNLSREVSIYLGLLVSAIIFGLMHFATYNWNLAQMIFVIGMSRFFITGLYIRSKNAGLSFVMHYLTDGIIMTLVLAVSMTH